MDEELRLDGYWYLPNTPDNEVFGQLIYTPGKILDLNLQGDVKPPTELHHIQPVFSNPPIIMGNESKNGRNVTLYQCQQTGASLILGNGHQITRFIVKAAFVGANFEQEDDVKFKSISVRFSNLEKWANKHPFDSEIVENNYRNLGIHYKSPNSVNAFINDLEVRVVFWGPNLSNLDGNKLSISYETRVEIAFQEEKSFEKYLSIIRRLQNFFGLAMGVPTYPISVTGLSDSNMTEFVNGKNTWIPIDIYFPAASWPEVLIDCNESKMLFTLPTIESNFDLYLRNWIDKFDLLEPSINLYFSVLYNPHSYAEVKFLSLAQALETYHRRVFGGEYLNKKEYHAGLYKVLANALPSGLGKDFENSLKSRLRYGNEYSLRTRLREIIESVREELPFAFVRSTEEKKTFINLVVDTRNYWTHYSPELADKAARTAEERLVISTNLQLLLEVRFLKELGFDSPTIQNLIKRSDRFKLLVSRGY